MEKKNIIEMNLLIEKKNSLENDFEKILLTIEEIFLFIIE